MVGLSYKKTDLHVHTPASTCFYEVDKNITPEEFIDFAINQGIEVMAITDHNSAEWIDKIKKAAIGKNITIFPGVEVSVKEGFHIIALFEIDKDCKYVNDFLMSGLQYKSNELGNSSIKKQYAEEVIDKIIEFNGLPIIAHVDSKTVGPFYKVVDYAQLTTILENEKDVAVETETGLLTNLFKEKQIKREPVCYKASDNPAPECYQKHSHRGLGSKYTYFKLDKNINLNSLRQCFIDPEVRIKIEELEENNSTYIEEISTTGGFLDKKKVIFHKGLNSLIGGKGTGKSLIIEFLRFALQDESLSKEIQEDSFSKIAGQLGKDGIIEVIISKGGEKYKITRKITNIDHRTKKFVTENKCEILFEGNPYEGDIKKTFPLLAYSQNEIIYIAKNDNALLSLLDIFIDESENELTINQVKNDIRDINSQFLESYCSQKDKIEKEKEIKTKDEDLKQIRNQIKALTSEDFQEIKKVKDAIEKEQNAILEAEKIIQTELLDKIINLNENIILPTQFSTNKTKFSEEIIKEFYNNLKGKLTQLEKQAIQDKGVIDKKLEEEKNRLTTALTPISKKYNELQENSNKIKDLEQNEDKTKKFIDKLQEQFNILEEKSKKFEIFKIKRAELIESFKKLKQERYNNRIHLYNEITKLSNKKLRVDLEHSAIKDNFIAEFENLLQSSGIRNKKENITKLIDELGIEKLIDSIFYRDNDSINQFLSGDNPAEAIISWIWNNNKIVNLLNIYHEFYPEDKPVIEYNKGKITSPNYAKLNELSVGQKCNALLIIALLEGDFPVIIDQPEDALDITSVYEDVSQNLRKNKDKRQFIITTHNNCVAVSSDSDSFICLNSNGKEGFVSVKGGVESSIKEIIEHLEGGVYSYKLRNQKYLIK